MCGDVLVAFATPNCRLSKARTDRVKLPLFIAGLVAGGFLTLAGTSHAEPHGDRFHGGQTVGRGPGIRRHFGSNRGRAFIRRDQRIFFRPFAFPVYWLPYGSPYNDPNFDLGPDDYNSDDSIATVQPESFGPAVDHRPIVLVIDKGNPGPTEPSPYAGYVNGGYRASGVAGQQSTVAQDPNEKNGPRDDSSSFVPPAVKPAQTSGKRTQTTPEAQTRTFGNFVLVSWLEEAGKNIIYVQNTETNEIEKITSEPNLDNFRIVELRANSDPRLVEAIISNGSQQGHVRFRF
jgi:hypothetical protein